MNKAIWKAVKSEGGKYAVILVKPDSSQVRFKAGLSEKEAALMADLLNN